MSSLQDAQSICKAVASRAGSPSHAIVMYSGGKESLCVLDLCTQFFDKVTAVFWYLVPGLRCIEGPLEANLARYPGVELLKVPNISLADELYNSKFRPHTHGLANAPLARTLKHIEAQVRATTGALWSCYGWRRADSYVRRAALNQYGHVDATHGRFYPLATWNRADVYGYLRAKGIEVPEQPGVEPGKYAQLSGAQLRHHFIRWLAKYHPDDFRRLLEVFPYAETLLVRDTLYPDTVPKVPVRAARKKRAQARPVQPAEDGQVGQGEAAQEPEADRTA